jgi:RNA polymerase sigma-54 factor
MKQQSHQNQKQQQKQGYYLSQQYLKLMHLMHLSGYALQEYITTEMEQNPALEMDGEEPAEIEDDANRENDFDSDYFDEDDDLFAKNYRVSTPEDYYEAPVVQFNSLQENLKEQIHQLELDDTLTEIACYIIDELEDDGYLRRKLEDVIYDYEFAKGKLYEDAMFTQALEAVQKCDPPGIGARDLRECLLIQLKRKPKHRISPAEKLACDLLENHYELFLQKANGKLTSLMGANDDDIRRAIEVIQHLNPKPVTETNKYELMRQQIVPDFEVTIDNDEIYVALTQSDFTKLRVNPEFEKSDFKVTGDSEKKIAENYFSRLVEDAQSLINALKERETTMIKIITVIASMQPTFFKTGDIKDLKPMILQDIATKTGYDISTISRVTSNKYVQTPHGIFILKKLFMRSINPDVEINSPKTSVVIQDEIKKIVDAEDKSNPLSDNSIVKKLAKMGITLARRTVVKYRETLDIPNSTLRKQ